MADSDQTSAVLAELVREPTITLRDRAIALLGANVDASRMLAAATSASELRIAGAKALRWIAMQAPQDVPAEKKRSSREAQRERREAALAKQQQAARDADRRGDLSPLERPIESLAGVGERVGKALRKRGIETVGDAALCLPRRYEDERVLTPLTSLVPGTRAVTVGRVASARWGGMRGRGRIAEVVLEPLPTDVPGRYAALRLVWFRAPGGLVERFAHGTVVRAAGTIEEYRGVLTITHPETMRLDEQGTNVTLNIVPRYVDVPGVPPRIFARVVKAASVLAEKHMRDAIPAHDLVANGLPRVGVSVRALHEPPNDLDAVGLAAWNEGRTRHHERLALEEFFVLELALHRRRIEEAGVFAEALEPNESAFERVLSSLPFALTQAQSRVVGEIRDDLRHSRPMRRLLQGDVGSGKTAVAMLSAAHAVAAGAQVAVLAPTEILAEQHYKTMRTLASALGLNMALFVGGARASHKKKVREDLARGVIDVAVGTHALLEEGVVFRRLRLAIVDEQHRFGVGQRLRLVEKASADGKPTVPHLLVMTATPIPRTLALSVYGDLDVSVIDQMPPGRKPPITRAYHENERDKALSQIDRALEAGGQAYVIYPLVEESEEVDLRDATSAYQELSTRFASAGVALLHGRLSNDEKHAAIEAFASGKVRVLVSTTVVEVGIDVPRANAIMIEHAERFGLAQLHQLRGRIGRGGQTSACLLVHDAKGEDAVARIRTLCDTTDGFKIAEADLEIRGAGELFGRKQSGMPGFRFGDLRRDVRLLELARGMAKEIFERDPHLNAPEHRGARDAVDALQGSERRVVKEEAG